MATKRNWTPGFYAGLYWIGIVTFLICLTFILAGNTAFLYRFEHTAFPLSWGFATLAILAFLLAELGHPVDAPTSETESEEAELVPNFWEAVEVGVPLRGHALTRYSGHRLKDKRFPAALLAVPIWNPCRICSTFWIPSITACTWLPAKFGPPPAGKGGGPALPSSFTLMVIERDPATR